MLLNTTLLAAISATFVTMPTSDQIIAFLHHAAYELHQAQQLITTGSDRVQTVMDELQESSDHATLTYPTIGGSKQRVHTLNEKMDRVYALRNDEHDSYLKQENDQLKRDLAYLQEAAQRNKEEYDVHLTDLVNGNQEMTHRVEGLEQDNNQLESKIIELMEQYEIAVLDNVNLTEANADLRDTVKSLQNTPAFNVVASSGGPNVTKSGTSTVPVSFGKASTKTNRGLTATTQSSPSDSPEKASLNRGRINQGASSAALRSPHIAPEPQSTSPGPAEGKPTLGRPKYRPIVRGTQNANESFERMKNLQVVSPLVTTSNTTVVPGPSTPGIDTPNIGALPVIPETPNKLKPKLNPAIDPFTPSNSNGKNSATSTNTQAPTPSKDESKSSLVKTSMKEEVIQPHLGRRNTNVMKDTELYSSHSQYSGKGKEKADIKAGIKPSPHGSALLDMKENVKAATPGSFVKYDPGLEAWHDAQGKNTSTKEATGVDMGTLIEVEPDRSLQAGENKVVPVPPGFMPMSSSNAPAKPETAAEHVEPSSAWASSSQVVSEKDQNALFLAAYNRNVGAIGEKYGKAARKKPTSDNQAKAQEPVDPIESADANPHSPQSSAPPGPTIGTHDLGALLDPESHHMVVKPRDAGEADTSQQQQQWKAVRKADGSVAYIL